MSISTKFKQFLQSISLLKENSESTAIKSEDRGQYKRVNSESDEDTNMKACLPKSRSIDDILDDIGLRKFHIKAYLILGLLAITDSLEVSVLAIVLPSIKSDLDISSLLAGVLTLSLSTGMIAGSSFWGWISDQFGRKRGFIGSTSFIIVFACASAFSTNYYWLWISLFLVGFGVSSAAQIYVMTMELFPPQCRSFFSILIGLFWSTGFLLSAIASTQLSVIGYHWFLAIVCFPTALSLIGTIAFLPDTPHYHLAAGDDRKALSILQDFAPEMDLSNTTLNQDTVTTKRADFTKLFKLGYWKITVCASIASFTTFMTYYALVYTASDIAGHEYNATSVSSVLVYNKLSHHSDSNYNLYSLMAWMNLPELFIITLAGVMCYIFTVKCALVTFFVLAIILFVVAMIAVNYRTALLVITLLSRSVLVSSVGIVFVYTSLLYPTENRSTGVGACIGVGRIGTTLGPFVFEVLFEKAYLKGIMFSIGSVLLGLLATVLLPSRSASLS